MGALDLVAKAAKAAKKAAPFYSKADEVLDSIQRGKGTGDEFLKELISKGVKPTELKERGIEAALKDKPKMSKADVQKVFEEKSAPKIQERVLGGDEANQLRQKVADQMFFEDYDALTAREMREVDAEVKRQFGGLETKYEDYKTPGGENYREILLKLPGFPAKKQERIMELEADLRRLTTNDPMIIGPRKAELEMLKAERDKFGSAYTSGHWDDPNVLAHIRVQDFKTPEGKKVLLVDEIQSDWHQAGRKHGYKKEDVLKKNDNGDWIYTKPNGEIVNFGPNIDEQTMRSALAGSSAAVPDAPFKKNWHELAMKRVLDYAAENGYDTVAITPGAEQAKRYDLSKQIKDVHYNQQKGVLVAYDLKGNQVIRQEGIDPNKVEDFVGKEVAGKLLSAPPEANGYSTLSGVDLQVGGEGMKGFYDKILPDYLNTYGKQYGASVGQMDLPLGYTEESKRLINDAHARGTRADIDAANAQAQMQTLPVHTFDITPQMREAIKTKGQPLYSAMGAEGLAGASGAATIGSEALMGNDEQPVQNPVHFTENPDAMRLELMQRN